MTPRPIVILPGIGGSILIKRGQEYKTVFGQSVLDNRWMNITPFAKGSLDRWRRDMRVDIVRAESGASGYRKVVGFANYDADIEPYDMGGIGGITNIVPEFSLLAPSYSDFLHRQFHFRYFGTLCDRLTQGGAGGAGGAGFEPKKNLFGLPYDARRLLDPVYRGEYFREIQETIEIAAGAGTAKKPVMVVAHSMGGVLLKWFLTDFVSPDWIQRHIGRLMIVNAPFGGTTMALRVIISGEYYVPMFHQEFKMALQKMAGILMCLPNGHAYSPEEPLVKMDTPARVLRLQDFMTPVSGLFPSDSLQEAFDIWRDMYLPYLPTIMKPLDVKEIPCDLIMGSQQPTVKKIKIRREGELPYYTRYEYGDGQVPIRSLALAQDIFRGSHVRPLEIPGANHIDVLSHPLFLDAVISRILC